MCLIVELNASTNMFYILKHLLLLNLVIFKLKCNCLIVNKIMVFNALYMCLLHSRLSRITRYGSWKADPSFLRWFCHKIEAIMHKRHTIYFQNSANHKGCLRFHWGAHKESGLSRPQTSSNDHQDLIRFSTIKSPWRRGWYKLFEIHNNLGDFRTTPSLSRGQIPKSNKHMEIIDEVFCLKILSVTQKGDSNLS
jgi:hypothetical protein